MNERDELWAGIRIFELANTIPTLCHFVYSSIDYYLQLTNFNHKYATHHTNGKGRVHTYLQGICSPAHPSSHLTWTVLLTGVYNEDLMGGPCVPQIAADGTRLFKLPLAGGSLPLITLSDCGTFALKIFQDREYWSGKTLNAASHFATGNEIAETLARVSGVQARYEPVSFDEWAGTIPFRDLPVAKMDPEGITFAQNFRMWWSGFQDNVLLETRDLEELKRIHPKLQSLEDWMNETGWDGTAKQVLKLLIDTGITAEMQQLKT